MFHTLSQEFLYETLHIRTSGQALRLGSALKCPGKNLRSVLAKYTRNLFIIPMYDFAVAESDPETIEDSLAAILEIVQACTRLQSAVVCADNVTLFCEPTYRPWVKILAALPNTLRHIDVRNFLLGHVVWSPLLFSSGSFSENLVSLRFDAAHPAVEHSFPALRHLSIFSWPTASRWDLPSLEALYVDCFPDGDLTRTFWEQPGGWPNLKLLHLGCDTDLTLYQANLPERLTSCVPALDALEYHIAGDMDVLFDPVRLSTRVKTVTVKTFQDYDYPRFEYGVVHIGPQEGRKRLEELDASLDNLTPRCRTRWEGMKRHFEKFWSEGEPGSWDEEMAEARKEQERQLVVLIPEGFLRKIGRSEARPFLRTASAFDNGLSIANINTEALSLWSGTQVYTTQDHSNVHVSP